MFDGGNPLVQTDCISVSRADSMLWGESRFLWRTGEKFHSDMPFQFGLSTVTYAGVFLQVGTRTPGSGPLALDIFRPALTTGPVTRLDSCI